MSSAWYETRSGLAVIVVYGVLTVGAALATTGRLVGTGIFVESSSLAPGQTPTYVYVYAFLGGMAYAFTSIVARFERGTPGVLRVGIRAVAAIPLAAGVFLLADALSVGGSGSQFLAGVAFLVGLYVNVTLKALGGLADRLFGRRVDAGEAGAPSADDGTGPSSR